MLKGVQDIHVATDEPSLSASVKAARQAGFDAFEPTLAETGAITITTEEANCRRAGEIIRGGGLAIHAAYCPLLGRFPLSVHPKTLKAHRRDACATQVSGCTLNSIDAAIQQQAQDIIKAALDRAAWLGAAVLVVDAGRITDDNGKQHIAYADALNATHAALEALVFEAEARGVVLGIRNPTDAFLLSPVEMRELVDTVGSPWVQVCLDTAAVQRHGFPTDWIETLSRRIVNVHATDCRGNEACPPGDGEVDWPAVAEALRRTGYAGPLVCMHAGDLNDMAGRLDQILAHS